MSFAHNERWRETADARRGCSIPTNVGASPTTAGCNTSRYFGVSFLSALGDAQFNRTAKS